jgi:hypothetical protein
MRRLLGGTVLALALLLALPGPRADGQSPAPAAETTDDAGDGRPWGRLLVFVPLSVAIGAAAIYGPRFVRERGRTRP